MKPTIVCVDDNPMTLVSLARVLKAVDAIVLTTNDPDTALAWIGAQEIALVIADVDMPGMSGIELVAAVRAVRPETVRILLTGMRTFDVAVDGINRGEVFRHLSKPLDPATIRQVVNSALARHRELVTHRAEHARITRRDQIRVALEVEFPSISSVERIDGTYTLDPPPPALLAGLGLDSIFALRRQS